MTKIRKNKIIENSVEETVEVSETPVEAAEAPAEVPVETVEESVETIYPEVKIIGAFQKVPFKDGYLVYNPDGKRISDVLGISDADDLVRENNRLLGL